MTDRLAWHVWYSHARWRRRSKRQLELEPLCQWCQRRGVITAARVTHHLVPHHGDRQKFWYGELISLCKSCHDSDGQRIERGGEPKQTVPIEGWTEEK
jgi:5-methylcytosine-specific restriction protein A